MSKPVEIEILGKDSLTPVLDKAGKDTEKLAADAKVSAAAYKELQNVIKQYVADKKAEYNSEIALLESQLENLRLVGEMASPDLDQTENCLAIQQLEQSIEELKSKILNLDKVSKSVDFVPKGVEQSQKKFNGLHNSIQQMAREMPSLAMGPQTFFMAISNNLPIFTDEVARARKEYNELIKTGQKGTPVWKQILSSLFSWQTALTTGIMLLVMYGDEIADWIGSLFRGEKQLTAIERAQRGLNEAIKENGYGIGDKILLVRALSEEWSSLGENLAEKERFIRDNKTEFEKLGVAVSNVNDAENLLVTSTPEFIEAMRLRAEAAAAQKLAAEEYETALKKERELASTAEYVESTEWEYKAGNGSAGRLSRRKVRLKNPEYERLEKEAKAARDAADAYYNKAAALELAATAKMKEAGVIDSDEAAKKQKEAEEAKRLAEEAARLAKEQKDKEVRLANELRQLRWDNEQEDINQMKDGSEKRIRQIKLDYEKEIAAIREQEEEWSKAQNGILTKEQRTELMNAYGNAEIKMRLGVEDVEQNELQKSREKLNALLNEYKTYDQRRRSIDDAYCKDMQVYNVELERLRSSGGDTSQIESSIQARTDVYKEEVQALEKDILRSTDFYDKLFSEVSAKGYKVLKNFYSQAKEMLDKAKVDADGVVVEIPIQDADGKFVKKAVKVTVAEFEKMKKQVVAIQRELEKKNPFAAFKTAWTDLSKSVKNGGDVSGALENLNSKGKELTSTIRGWGDSLGAVFGERFGQSCDEMMDMVDGVMGMGTGIAQIFAGDIVGGITNTLSGLSSIITTLASWEEKQKALEREAYIAEIETYRAQRKRNEEYAKSVDLIQDIITNQELLNWLVEKGYSRPNSVSVWQAHSEALEEYEKNLKEEIAAYDNIEERLRSSYAYWEWGTSADGGSVSHTLQNMSAAELELYYNQGKLTEEAKAYYEAWVESGKSIEDLKKNIEETYSTMQEMVMGTSFDGFLGNVKNALRNARGDVAQFASFAEDTIAEALMNAFAYQYLADSLKPLYDELSQAFIDGAATEEYLTAWKERFQKTMETETERVKQMGETAGVDIYSSRTSQSGKSGAFSQSITYDQASKLEGLFVSGQMHWSAIDEHAEDISEKMSTAESHLAKIEENTENCAKELKEVKEEIKKLNRDGIKMK